MGYRFGGGGGGGGGGAHIPLTGVLAKTPIRSTKDDLVIDHIVSPCCHAIERSFNSAILIPHKEYLVMIPPKLSKY